MTQIANMLCSTDVSIPLLAFLSYIEDNDVAADLNYCLALFFVVRTGETGISATVAGEEK